MNRLLTLCAVAALSLSQAQAIQANVTFYSTASATSACGPTINRGFAQVAVSRDLRYRFPCGSRVRVTLQTPKGGVRTFTAVANDRMPHGTPAQTIDILVKRHARLYGRTTATIVRLDGR